jgi:aryl-alcohol dehydrogenase-like predicted oxidoreductase
MQYRQLGKSNLKVSALCLGTMMFGDQTDAAEAARIVAHAHAQGVNFIDTADVYTRGASETMVGPDQAASATTGCWPPSSATP